MKTMLMRIPFVVAMTLGLGPARIAAQSHTTFAVDATIGSATGNGGEFFDRNINGARLAVSIRQSSHGGIGVFGELAMDWLGITSGHYAVCYASPRGPCLNSYPELSGPTAVFGLVADRGNHLELRAGIGGGAYAADGTRVGAVVSELDAAFFPMAHAGVVAGARWIVVPRYRGDRLSVLPWMIGLRFR